MAIVNLTHNKDGSVRLRRSVTTKLAIGLPPGAGANFPKKLDHFVFQKKGEAKVDYQDERGQQRKRSEVVWQPDEALQAHYGPHAKEVWIVLLDDDADVAFRTELAWWSKTARNCVGDGEVGRIKNGDKVQERPCANHGCPEWASGICKPSGDLYFLLADFPSLGTICKLHTTSFQSITEIRTALEDLRSVTGGRLMGLRVKLTVRIEKNVFKDKKKGGALTTSTKYVLGIELAAADVKALTASLTDNMKLFADVKLALGARSVQIVEDPDTAAAPSIAAEFYPVEDVAPAPGSVTVMTPASRPPARPTASAPGDDDDDFLPAEMYNDAVDPTPWSKEDARAFHEAWRRSKHEESAVRAFLRDVCGVESSLKVPAVRKAIAMKWAKTRAEAPPLPPAGPVEVQCREMMAALGLDLNQQMRVIDNCEGEWERVKDELNRIADEGMEND